MGCLFVLMAAMFPRTVLFIFWLARPDRVDEVFSTWFWPLLGIIFLPLATLLYAVLWTVGGLSGWAWFWVAIAAILDLGQSATAAANRRNFQGSSV